MIPHELHELNLPLSLCKHRAFNLMVHSKVLKKNPLGDPSTRHNYLLVPDPPKGPLPLIFHLSGYLSTGYQRFYKKSLNRNFVERIDSGVDLKKYPRAIHVFVEASTYWGGSQFINSPGCGLYRDYILSELLESVENHFEISEKTKHRCVMGASSGGYGALALISDKNSPFGLALAVAPDSFFEASLLPELFKAAPKLTKYKNLSQIRKHLENGEIQDKKYFFPLVNSVAMAHCYSTKDALKKDHLDWPIDLHSGEVNTKRWKQWLQHDPLFFLEKREQWLKDKRIYLEVGEYDNFSLQFGTRQIAKLLKNQKIQHQLTEFKGDHFGLNERSLLFMGKLKSIWKIF